ncbi:MAG: hypothetical protein ACXVIH_15770 [Ilumatobacteraceae bacterium]
MAYPVILDCLDFDDSPLSLEARPRCAMRSLRDDCAEVAQVMNGLDIDPQLRHGIPRGADLRGGITQVELLQ